MVNHLQGSEAAQPPGSRARGAGRSCPDLEAAPQGIPAPSGVTWLTTCKGKEAARAIERAGDRPDDRQHHQGDKPHQGETTAPRIQSERGGGDHAQIWKQHPRGSPPRLVLPGDYLVTGSPPDDAPAIMVNHLQGNRSSTAPRIPAHAPPIVDTIMPGSPPRLVLPGDYLVTPPCHQSHQIPRGSRE